MIKHALLFRIIFKILFYSFAGDVLGHARRSSLRVRFSLAQLGESDWVVADPTEPMHTWSVLPWCDESTPRAVMRRAA